MKHITDLNSYIAGASIIGQGTLKRHSNPMPMPKEFDPYVLPVKQDFVKDARLMPGTRLMLMLISGWAGQGSAIETTLATLGKHLCKSVSQIRRYVKDAKAFGYLSAGYTKSRIGYITGLRLKLRFEMIRPKQLKKTAENKGLKPKTQRSCALPYRNNTNRNNNIYRDECDPYASNRLKNAAAMMQKRILIS